MAGFLTFPSFNQLKPYEETEDSVYMCPFHFPLEMTQSK